MKHHASFLLTCGREWFIKPPSIFRTAGGSRNRRVPSVFSADRLSTRQHHSSATSLIQEATIYVLVTTAKQQ